MDNIFIVIENYLAEPTAQLAEKIKLLSSQLKEEAVKKATALHPGKTIGGDEYQVILIENIAKLARDAASCSVRFIDNTNETPEDPLLIFKLNKDEQQKIHQLIGLLLINKKHAPDGLIFAYHGYIERQKTSRFSYCEHSEALIRKNNTLLRNKSQSLEERNQPEAAKILKQASVDIHTLCNGYFMNKAPDEPLSPEFIKNIARILSTAKEEPAIKAVSDWGIKQIIANFLLCLTTLGLGLIYLAATQHTRGAFWYRPHTDSELTIEAFQLECNKL